MHFLAINAVGPYERKRLNGREHWVVPFVSLVEGVLNGSKGALYYPKHEIAKNPGVWNGIPVTLGHPTDAQGNAKFARDPEVLNRVGLGQIFNDRIEDGKRKGEAWLDVEYTKTKAPDVYNKLSRNELIELSTGLQTDDYVSNGKDAKGRQYDLIASNYRPDHLAILIDQRGACSINDGCGLGMNAEWVTMPTGAHVLVDEDGEVKAGLGKQSKEDEDFEKFVAETVAAHNAFLPNQPRSQVTGRIKLPNAGVGKGPVHEAAQDGWFGGKCDVCGATLTNGVCEACKELETVINGGPGSGKAHMDASKAHRSAHVDLSKDANATINSGVNDMDRTKAIAFLVANCDCWKGKETLLANTELFDDRDVFRLANNIIKSTQNALVVNALVEKLGDKAPAVNAMPAFIKEKVDAVEAVPPTEKQKVGKTAVEDEDEEVPVANRKKPMTVEEYFADPTIPTPIKSAVRNAMKVERREMDIVINKLTAHITDPAKLTARKQKLSTLNLDELYDRLADMPAVTTENARQPEPEVPPIFGSGNYDYIMPTENKEGDIELLDLPKMNWGNKVA